MAVRANASADHLKRQGGMGITSPPWTVCGWVCRRGTGAASFSGVITLSDNNTTDGVYCPSDEGGVGTPRYVGFGGSGAITDSNFTNNQWRFIACSIENATNGAKYWRHNTGAGGTLTLVGQATPTASRLTDSTNLEEIWLGDSRFGGEWWNGSWCCVRGWNAVLSQAELEAELVSPTPVRTSGLQFAYRLSTDSDINDTSGNGRNLVENGTIDTDSDEPSEIAVGDVNITPATVVGTITIPSPTMSVGSTVSPATVAGVGSIPAPTVNAGVGISPSTVQGVVTIPAVTIDVAGNVNITPVTVQGSVNIPSPSMSMGATATPDTVLGVVGIPSPSLFTDQSVNIMLQTVQGVVTIPSPEITATLVNIWETKDDAPIETVWTRSEDDLP